MWCIKYVRLWSFPLFHGSYSVPLLQKVIKKFEGVGDGSSKRHLTFCKGKYKVKLEFLEELALGQWGVAWVGEGGGGGGVVYANNPTVGEVWVIFFLELNPLVEKENFIHKMADFYCITNSDISLLVVNCDWLITQHSIVVEDVLLEQLVTP